MKFYPPIFLYTEYSILESNTKINSLIKFAKKYKLDRLVITDHNSMYGIGEFIEKTRKNGIKPIIGLDLDVEDFRLILLAKNYLGFKELLSLSSKKMSNNEITLEDIKKVKNVFIIDHPSKGYYAKTSKILDLQNFYVGTTKESFDKAVLVYETRFLKSFDNDIAPILDFLAKRKITNPKFKEPVVYSEKNWDERVRLAISIIKSCNIEFPEKKLFMPVFDKTGKTNAIMLLRKIVENNFSVKLTKIENIHKYKERLEYELEIIEKLNLADYFMIIYDLVKWAKENKIIIGPGRGSSVSSLVAYLLGITAIDPLKYNLIFERFLNPKRVAFPDIDIDIEDDRRIDVMNYLFSKYGKNKVAQIITFQRFGSKIALRDVAKFLKYPQWEIDSMLKTIPSSNKKLVDIYDSEPKFKAWVNSKKENFYLFEKAHAIENIIRQAGTHAAGVVISPDDISLHVPVQKTDDNYLQSQIAKDYLENFGLLKIDLLGLKNLTILKNIKNEIQKNFNKTLLVDKIPVTCKKTLKLFASGKTNGIFQCESYGMKNTLKKINISSIDDLIAAIALYRPGPLQFIDEYAKRKKGKAFEKIHPIFDEVVKETYGILIYQEQIMQFVQKFANLSFEQADVLVKAISKKDPEIFEEQKKLFFASALRQNHSKEMIERLFNLIEKFVNYGFNKSHAVAYAHLAYWMGFLKVHFPLEFYMAQIKASLGSTEDLRKIIFEARERVKILMPTINNFELSISTISKKILLPLTIIKGISKKIAKEIFNEKQNKLFSDFFDFVVRMKKNRIDSSIIKTLIESQVLKVFGNVKSLLVSLPFALRYADMVLEEKNGELVPNYDLAKKPQLVFEEKDANQEVILEKNHLGFNLSLFITSNKELENKLLDVGINKPREVVFFIESVRKLKDKNDKDFLKMKVSDSTLTITLYYFDVHTSEIDRLTPGKIIKGKVFLKIFGERNLYILSKSWGVIEE